MECSLVSALSSHLSEINHDLRSPISVLAGALELLHHEALSDEGRRFVEIGQRSVEHMHGLLGRSLLQLVAATELGDDAETSFDPLACVEEVLDIAAAAAGRRRIDPAYDLDSPLPSRVVGDEVAIKRTLLTCIGDLLQFPRQQCSGRGYVRLAAAFEARDADVGVLKFVIRDSGEGLIGKHAETLFESDTASVGQSCDAVFATRRVGNGGSVAAAFPVDVHAGEAPLAGTSVYVPVVDTHSTLANVLRSLGAEVVSCPAQAERVEYFICCQEKLSRVRQGVTSRLAKPLRRDSVVEDFAGFGRKGVTQ